MTPRLTVRRLGLAEYAPVWRAMQDFTDSRDETTGDGAGILLQMPDAFLRAVPEDHVLEVVRSGASGIARGPKGLSI